LSKFTRRDRKCAACGVVLPTAAELAEMLDLPHSTVALKLKRAGISPVVYEGGRALYNGPQALAILVSAFRRPLR
jgi:hypothetical protein